MVSPWPVSVHAYGPAQATSHGPAQASASHVAPSCGTVLWRMNGAARVTVVVKARFRLQPGVAALVEPEALLLADRLRDGAHSVDVPGDLAPYLPGAGVLLRGHACAPGGRPVPSLAVRLSLHRGDQPLLDKVLHVVGDRAHPSASPAPFVRIPIVYERAHGGPAVETNPVGTGRAGALPNILLPAHPERPAGFGPIARHWAPRRYLRPGPSADSPAPELGDGADFRYYHAAPLDQQIGPLRGDERLHLENLHPHHPQVSCALPGLHATARVLRAGSQAPLDLVADTLWIDADALLVTVLWRGNYALARGELPAHTRVEVWLSTTEPRTSVLPERTSALPERTSALPAPPSFAPPVAPSAPAAPAPEVAPGRRKPMLEGGQATIEPPVTSAMKPVAPFAIAAPAPDQKMATPVAGTPWSAERPRPITPVIRGDLRATTALPDGASSVDISLRATQALPDRDSSVDISLRATQALPDGAPAADISLRATQALPDGASAAHLSPSGVQAPLRQTAPDPGSSSPRGAPLPFAPADPWATPVIAQPGLPAGRTRSVLGTGTLQAPDSPPPVARALPFAGSPSSAPLPPAVVTSPVAPPPPAAPEPPPVATSPVATSPAETSPFTTSPVPLPPPAAPAPPPFTTSPAATSPAATSPAATPPAATPPAATPPAATSPVATPPVVAPPPPEPPRGVRDTVLARLASGQSLRDLPLAGATLDDIDFGPVALERHSLAGASLRGSNLAGAGLSQANLAGADLTGTILSNADLSGADLSRATAARTRLDGARLDGASLASLDTSDADLSRATLVRADLRQARLLRCNLDGARLDGALAAKSDVSRSTFAGASLQGTSFRGARLREAVLARADVTSADLRDADLSQANVHGVTLSAAKTGGANLRGIVDSPPPERGPS